jgi:hypothetical protein
MIFYLEHFAPTITFAARWQAGELGDGRTLPQPPPSQKEKDRRFSLLIISKTCTPLTDVLKAPIICFAWCLAQVLGQKA